jgi:hypothetical protein
MLGFVEYKTLHSDLSILLGDALELWFDEDEAIRQEAKCVPRPFPSCMSMAVLLLTFKML